MQAPSSHSSDDSLRAAAAAWLVRRDRGLSAAESIEYELWLAADERHAAAINRAASAWSLLDRLPEEVALPVLAAATRRRVFWRRTYIATGAIAAAAVLVIGVLVWRTQEVPAQIDRPAPAIIASASPRTVMLSDGSIVQLNAGGEISEQFTVAERRVVLAHGEAHFAVAKNPARPFIVRAGALQIRAVGTAFNVNLQSAAVDVIVTEGRVQLAARPGIADKNADESNPAAPTLDAGHRAVLRGEVAPGRDLKQALDLSLVDPTEMARVLAWREPLLHLGGSTLAELAAEFERVTGRRLLLADPSLGELRFGGRFRADDVEGFTHLIATTLDLEVERFTDGTILLRKKKSDSR